MKNIVVSRLKDVINEGLDDYNNGQDLRSIINKRVMDLKEMDLKDIASSGMETGVEYLYKKYNRTSLCRDESGFKIKVPILDNGRILKSKKLSGEQLLIITKSNGNDYKLCKYRIPLVFSDNLLIVNLNSRLGFVHLEKIDMEEVSNE